MNGRKLSKQVFDYIEKTYKVEGLKDYKLKKIFRFVLDQHYEFTKKKNGGFKGEGLIKFKAAETPFVCYHCDSEILRYDGVFHDVGCEHFYHIECLKNSAIVRMVTEDRPQIGSTEIAHF